MRTGPGGILSPVNERPSTPNEEPGRPIALVDSTMNRAATPSEARTSSIDLVDTETGSSPQPDYVLERRWTKQSLQRQLTHRKYAQYQEHRLIDRRATERDDSDSLASASQLPLNSGNTTRLARLFARRKIRPTREQDTVIDVLYENQRGVITLGVPHFSSNSLLNFDPKPWTNAHRRTSPVNITNAQVPDPNWVWAWDSWYVDMSRDVDEQGWEYSFWFQDSAAWHGNHPWFHSFVRRRRWLRKRVRAKHLADIGEDQRTESPRSEPAPARPAAASSMGALINAIKACSIDRERLVMIRAFLAEPNNDVHDLTDEVSLCVVRLAQLCAEFDLMKSNRCRISSRYSSFRSRGRHWSRSWPRQLQISSLTLAPREARSYFVRPGLLDGKSISSNTGAMSEVLQYSRQLIKQMLQTHRTSITSLE